MRRRPVLLLLVLSPCTLAFKCDGGRTVIPKARVGDDYCDCADGSDELATGACPDTLFECPCRPSKPVTVFASRVNDGVCDCCDGADEKPSAGCPNTCVDVAKAELARTSKASLARAEREARGRDAAKRREIRLAEARAALAAGADEVRAAREAKAAAEAAETARRSEREQRLQAGEVGSALRLSELTEGSLRVVLARLALAKHVSGVDALHDLLSASPLLQSEMADVDSADLIEVAMEAKEAEEEAGEAASCANAASACGFEEALLKLLPLGELPPEELADLVRKFAEQNDQMASFAQARAAPRQASGRRFERSPLAAC